MSIQKAQMKVISVKVDVADEERFHLIHEQLNNAALGQTFATLLDRFEQPLKIEDHNDRQRQEIERLHDELGRREEAIGKLTEQVDALTQQVEAGTAERNRYAQQTQAAELALENERQARTAEAMKADEYRIMLLPDTVKALDYVAHRESQRRKQAWSRSHVINHFIFARFVRGELNGDLRTIPDSDLKKMGISKRTPTQPTTDEPTNTTTRKEEIQL